MARIMRTAGALVASAAITVTTLAGTPAAQASAPVPAKTDDSAAALASTWIKGQLTSGLAVGKFGPDFGLSIDIALGLDQTGNDSAVRTISGAVASKIESYISGGTSDPDSTYAGATAKAATLARIAGGNPTSYGGVNLVTRLESRVATAAPITGRIEDKSTFGDFANVVGQSFAARALVEAKSARAADAVKFLLQQQCAGGYFRLDFTKDKANASQGCVDGAADSAADLDATSLVVVNLAASGDTTPEVAAALAKAGAWLAARQASSGAFGVVGATGKPNTNSTGLAGWALGSLNNKQAAADAAVWVRKRQPVDKNRCFSALSKSLGAVAYDDIAVRSARTAGVTAETTDQWRRATAQALPVLQWAPASPDKLRVVGNTARAEARTKVRFSNFGLAPGERACVSVQGDFKRVVGKATGGKIAAKLEMPNGNAKRKVKLKTADAVAKAFVLVRN
ncbi:hypothetical protein [Nocardioides sp. LHG3406-4]|uniref:hypothetical protein n=1 Tax=Nocardioides sp. LHG3406-4 TaxID=2804575 RepID=UPI003CF2A877